MLKKITEIFTEEEIVKAILQCGKKAKVEDFIKKYIDILLEKEIAINKLCYVVEGITSPELLHTIAEACIEQGDSYVLSYVLDNPHCPGEIIVMAEKKFPFSWIEHVWWDYSEGFEKLYPKEKLWKIAMADKNGICSVGIIECDNCDEELFYKLLENCKGNAEHYSNFCGLALKQKYTLRQDILEEMLDNFLDSWSEDIARLISLCNEGYLERVMAKIEENSSEEVREKARAAYAERKGSK